MLVSLSESLCNSRRGMEFSDGCAAFREGVVMFFGDLGG